MTIVSIMRRTKRFSLKMFDKCFKNMLRSLGYLKCDYGFACGRHWVEIDGYVLAQVSGEACPLRDEDVHRIGYVCLDHGKYWDDPKKLYMEIEK